MVLSRHDFDPIAESSLLHDDFLEYQITTPDWYVETDRLPYGSTPLDPYRRDVWRGECEGSTRDILRKLYQSPPDELNLSGTVTQVAVEDFDAGMTAREQRNYDKYWTWRSGHEKEFNDLMGVEDSFWSNLIERATVGDASPGDLINLMQHSSLHAMTLASLSMPYGYRAEQYPKMMADIEASMKEFGGDVYETQQRGVYHVKDFARHYQIEQISGPTGACVTNEIPWAMQRQAANETHFTHGDLAAILVTYKRKVGRFFTDRDDQSQTECEVRERISSVIVCDEAHDFPPKIRANLQCDHDSVEYKSAEEFLIERIQSDEHLSYCLPLSSCIYATRNEREPIVPMELVLRAMAQRAAMGVEMSGGA